MGKTVTRATRRRCCQAAARFPTTLLNGVVQYVSSGGSTTGTVFSGTNNQQYVYAGGTTTGTSIIGNNANQYVSSGGVRSRHDHAVVQRFYAPIAALQ